MSRHIGVSAVAHDAAVCLIQGDRVVFAIEEERLSRVKNAEVFPRLALQRTLSEHQLRLSDIASIGYYWDPTSSLRGALRWARPDALLHPSATARLSGSLHLANAYMWRTFVESLRAFAEERVERVPRVKYLPHHDCHAHFAYGAAPFERAAILVADGMGEAASTSMYEARPGALRRLASIDMPHSLGFVYASVTQFLGFRPASDEWKVMGLAAYGGHDPALAKFFEELVVLLPDGGYAIDRQLAQWHHHPRLYRRLLSARASQRLGGPRAPDEPIGDRHRDIAHALQARLEEVLLHVLRGLHRRTKLADLCLAGGVALNCVANGRVLRESPFERVHVPYAPGDSGAAIGAGLLAAGVRPQPNTHPSPYLGPAFTEEQILRDLAGCGLQAARPADIHRATARLIAAGEIVGWVQGAMELGPRALGHRSILADPRRADMQARVNQTVKYRETFRPFAPAVLAERASEWFEDAHPSPYMSFALRVRDPRIPAVTHVDGTGRLQTVSRDASPSFHRLISTFADETGIPVVLNTSFNVRGEPIVCSPTDAIRCFFGSGLQHLAIGPFLVSKAR